MLHRDVIGWLPKLRCDRGQDAGKPFGPRRKATARPRGSAGPDPGDADPLLSGRPGADPLRGGPRTASRGVGRAGRVAAPPGGAGPVGRPGEASLPRHGPAAARPDTRDLAGAYVR